MFYTYACRVVFMDISRESPISPLDGRYASEVGKLRDYFSESALMRERVIVELEYLKHIMARIGRGELLNISKHVSSLVLSREDLRSISKLEAKFEHDVKAVEVFLSRRLGLSPEVAALLHYGLTSEDVNNIAYSRLLKKFVYGVLIPSIVDLATQLCDMAARYRDTPMLARTHGQPAAPTTFGKELAVFAFRVGYRLEKISDVMFYGKLNGAVGNYSSLVTAHPEIDWTEFSDQFVTKMGLHPWRITTQILPYDWLSDLLHLVRSLNNILVSLNRDLWMYGSYGYLRVIPDRNEVGSSTMPQKVNPKDFENSEGNLEVSNSLLEVLEYGLQVNRLQRDLSDSTIRRNLGVAMGHAILGYSKLLRGLGKIAIDPSFMLSDLERHPEVYSEAVQILLRDEGNDQAYFRVLTLLRSESATLESLLNLLRKEGSIKSVRKFRAAVRKKYIGLAPQLTDYAVSWVKDTVSKVREKLKYANLG
jgi:adenylosuccinate lyase